ncbi:MAG: hypothetical protein AAF423_01260 [Pseudomonadota bacterium]
MIKFEWPGQANTRCLPVWITPNLGDWKHVDREDALLFLVLDRVLLRSNAIAVFGEASEPAAVPRVLAYYPACQGEKKDDATFWLAMSIDPSWENFRVRILSISPEGTIEECQLSFNHSKNSSPELFGSCRMVDKAHWLDKGFDFPDLTLDRTPRNQTIAEFRVPFENGSYGKAITSNRLGDPVLLSSNTQPGSPSQLKISAYAIENPYTLERAEPGYGSWQIPFAVDTLYRVPRAAIDIGTLPRKFRSSGAIGDLDKVLPFLTPLVLPKGESTVLTPGIGDFIVYRSAYGKQSLNVLSVGENGKEVTVSSLHDENWGIEGLHVFEIGRNYQLIPVNAGLEFADDFKSKSDGDGQVAFASGLSKPHLPQANRAGTVKELLRVLHRRFNEVDKENDVLAKKPYEPSTLDLYPQITLDLTAGCAISNLSMALTQLLFAGLVNQLLNTSIVDRKKIVALIEKFEKTVDTGMPGIYRRLCSPLLQFICARPDLAQADSLITGANDSPGIRVFNEFDATDFSGAMHAIAASQVELSETAIRDWEITATVDQAAYGMHLISSEKSHLLEWLAENSAALQPGNAFDLQHTQLGTDPLKLSRELKRNAFALQLLRLEWREDKSLLDALNKLAPEGHQKSLLLMDLEAALKVQGNPASASAIEAENYLSSRFTEGELQNALQTLVQQPEETDVRFLAWEETNAAINSKSLRNGWITTASKVFFLVSSREDSEFEAVQISSGQDNLGNNQQQDNDTEAKQTSAEIFRDRDSRVALEALSTWSTREDSPDRLRQLYNDALAPGSNSNDQPTAQTVAEMTSSCAKTATEKYEQVERLYSDNLEKSPGFGVPNNLLNSDERREMRKDYDHFHENHGNFIYKMRNKRSSDMMENLDAFADALDKADEFIERWSRQ